MARKGGQGRLRRLQTPETAKLAGSLRHHPIKNEGETPSEMGLPFPLKTEKLGVRETEQAAQGHPAV